VEGKVEERGRKGVSVLEVEGTGRHRKLMTFQVYQSSNETGDYRLVFIISILLLRDILNACQNEIHSESKKTRHQTLSHNFTKYHAILKIFSLADSAVNLQQTHV